MTRSEAIEEACKILGLAYHSIGDYSQPSDGFCDKCPARGNGHEWNFQNDGHALKYVRQAVIEKLKRDGFTIKEH